MRANACKIVNEPNINKRNGISTCNQVLKKKYVDETVREHCAIFYRPKIAINQSILGRLKPYESYNLRSETENRKTVATKTTTTTATEVVAAATIIATASATTRTLICVFSQVHAMFCKLNA